MSVFSVLQKSQKIRFGVVGLLNTLADIGILNFLVWVVGTPLIFANLIATTVAMILSFFLNKNTVFHNHEKSRRQIVLFVFVTAIGLWVIQTAALVGMYAVLEALPEEVRLNIAKVAGIACSMTWNYIWYSRVVFRRS